MTPSPISIVGRPGRESARCGTALLLSALCGAVSLHAQSTNETERLPSVVVTAQKEPAPLEALPVSVTAVPSEVMRDADVRLVRDAGVYAPNVFFNEFTARKLSFPYFRGVGASPNNPGVTTYIDGVPQLNANSSSIELLDVDQVEFVRGPQGALFGRNTVGGVINIQSRRPSPTWTSEAIGQYGNFNFRDVRVTLAGPAVEDKLGMRLGLGYSARDGYTKNDVTGHDLDSREALFGKGQLLWTPNEQWELQLIFTGERARDGDYALGDLDAIRERPHHVSHDYEGHTDRDLLAPTFIATRRGEKIDFSLISGLVWWETDDATDLDYTALPAVTRANNEEDLQVTEELRFSSAEDAPITLSDDLDMKWQAGLFFFSQQYEQDAANVTQPPFSQMPVALTSRSQAELDDIGLGVYGQSTVTAWEKFDLSAAFRADYEYKEADLGSAFSPEVLPGTSLNADRDFFEVSPQFSLAYRPSTRHTLYGTVSRGFKAGGFNPSSDPGRETYDEENTWSYELGVKSRWLNDRLSARLALFYINWDDLQLNLPTGVPGQYYIDNAGEADSKGVELELALRPVSGWEIFGSVGYTDARFLSGAQAGHTDPLGADSLVGVGGNRLIYTPEFTANTGMQYTWQATRHVALYARGEVTVYGDFYYNPLNTARQDTFSLADFRAGVRGKHWFAEGWVRNAFDEEYVPIAFEFPNGAFGGSGFVGESGAPVTYGLRAGILF